MIGGVTGPDLDRVDPLACPFLGLGRDPRTHHTFPHPDHRCFASLSPAAVGPKHQAAHCLSRTFLSCELFRSWPGTKRDAG
jgi:hypothetical protein